MSGSSSIEGPIMMIEEVWAHARRQCTPKKSKQTMCCLVFMFFMLEVACNLKTCTCTFALSKTFL